jgi:hypothetical protein
MPVEAAEAEAYELPDLVDEDSAGRGNKAYGAEDEEGEEARLLHTKRGAEGLKEEVEELGEGGDVSPDYVQAAQDEEVVGRGSNVEALIARVSW